MIISTIITRNKKPAQATYQMANPEQPVQNELKVNSEVVLNNDEDNTQELHLKIVEPIQDVPTTEEDKKLISSTEETEQTNTSDIVEEGKSETLTIQEQSSEQEQVQEQEQIQEQEQSSEQEQIQEQKQTSEQEPVQESEQPQIEKAEETPKKKASSKKK